LSDVPGVISIDVIVQLVKLIIFRATSVHLDLRPKLSYYMLVEVAAMAVNCGTFLMVRWKHFVKHVVMVNGLSGGCHLIPIVVFYCLSMAAFLLCQLRYPRVGRAQLYRLSFVDVHTVAQNQYMGK